MKRKTKAMNVMAPVQMKTEQMPTKGTKEVTETMLAEKTLQEVMMGKPVNRMK